MTAMRFPHPSHFNWLTTLLMLTLAAATLWAAGCASLQPATPQQAQISAYAVLDQAAGAADVLLQQDVISVETAREVAERVREAYDVLELSEAAFAIGDLDTAIARLQAAQTIVDALNKFLGAHKEALR